MHKVSDTLVTSTNHSTGSLCNRQIEVPPETLITLFLPCCCKNCAACILRCPLWQMQSISRSSGISCTRFDNWLNGIFFAPLAWPPRYSHSSRTSISTGFASWDESRFQASVAGMEGILFLFWNNRWNMFYFFTFITKTSCSKLPVPIWQQFSPRGVLTGERLTGRSLDDIFDIILLHSYKVNTCWK